MDAGSIAAAAVATPPPGPAVTVQVPRGQVDLIDFIDWTGVECLNQDSSHSIVNALKQVGAAFLLHSNPSSTSPSLWFQRIMDSALRRFLVWAVRLVFLFFPEKVFS
jgi:hypothetical protein